MYCPPTDECGTASSSFSRDNPSAGCLPTGNGPGSGKRPTALERVYTGAGAFQPPNRRRF